MKRRTAVGLITSGLVSGCGVQAGSSARTTTVTSTQLTLPERNYLGLNVGTEMSWTARRDGLIPYYKQAGVKWIRVWYNWASIESEPGRYDFNYVYSPLKLAKDNGFLVTFVIWGTPDFAGSGELAAMPKLAAFERYCTWLKSELSEVVDAWEVGNEPNLSKYFLGSPQDYVQLLAHAYEILSGDTLVVAAGPSGASKPDYWQALLDANLEAYCDRLNLHPYQKNPGRVLNLVDDFKSRINKPLWITELGLSTEVNGEDGKADFTAILLSELQSRVETLLWYRSIQGEQIHPEQFGLLAVDKASNEITALPAYDAYLKFAKETATL